MLDRRLAACASSWPIASTYWWKGALEAAEEVVILFKTTPKRVGALIQTLEREHPYDVPEVLELDVPRATDGYLAYLVSELGSPAALRGPRGRLRRRGSPSVRGVGSPRRTRARPRRR